VPAGSVFGLLGPNGAGKTTTLRLVTGLARPTGGSVAIDGRAVTVDGAAARRGIGVLDQDPRYYGWMTGRELVELAARLQGLSRQDAGVSATATLELVGLAEAARRRVGGYSGGMRQRLGIAQALVGAPRLLILDEPVSSLDPEGRRDLLALIADLRASATVIFSTHVLADVERICDRVGILDRGRLVTEGPLADLLGRYAGPLYRIEPEPGQAAAVAELVSALRATPWVDGVTEEAHGGRLVVSVTDEAAAAAGLLPLVVAAGLRLTVFERARPTLEDVFLRLVGRDPAEGISA
jgi:ABC-2 type transport system ATP-binding protein